MLSCIYFAYIFFLSHPFLSISAHPLSLATFQSHHIPLSFPMIFSPSVFLSFYFSPAQLRNTVKWPKKTALLLRGEKTNCAASYFNLKYIFQPLQVSPPSSVKLSMKPISHHVSLSPPLLISLIIFISLPPSLSLLNLISQSFFLPPVDSLSGGTI